LSFKSVLHFIHTTKILQSPPMQNTGTYNQLVRFIYRDMNANEAMQMSEFIDSRLEVRLAFDDLLTAKFQLPKALFNPAPSTLKSILQYSAQTSMETYN
jgi:hypothetical protein